MDNSQWSYDEEAVEWLRRFSLSLDFVAEKGANFTKEEVQEVTTNEEVPRQLLSHPDVENCSKTPPINGPVTDKDAKDELDSFSSSRRQAIESTMINNLDDLPSLHEIIGLEEVQH
ncbi:unnamed protein product [Heligmosomoides polygyrus]|uniref:Sterile alpha and TIR motif-containing protein 1 n=1 Tax=Heligmosomoides polygyrus TaxID=6339 RepID=A0A183GPP7_HELPZ|nr:unnamed protein product [Heligmosomoides polygyrus]